MLGTAIVTTTVASAVSLAADGLVSEIARRMAALDITSGAAPEDRIEPAFTLEEPDRLAWPIVLNSPHSGRDYPTRFLARSRLDLRSLRASEDAFVDELARPLVARGVPMLSARFPRAYLDVNREPFELDTRLFGPVPAGANTASIRVAAGLGTIARVVSETREIYREPPALDEALARIRAYYEPYHAALSALVERVRARFGVCVLVDLHSMPSAGPTPRDARGGGGAPRGEARGRADYVIGDRHGASCAPAVTQALHKALHDALGAGSSVRRNAPYAGGFITETYGRPATGVHAVQIEINRALYMDEARIRPLSARGDTRGGTDKGGPKGMDGVQADLARALDGLTGLDWDALRDGWPAPLAAE